MNILLVNDDGINAQGLKQLAKKLSEKHNIFLIAPDSNRSAVSHCISIYNELDIVQVDKQLYSSSGFPADCTSLGIISDLFQEKIDLVISGINEGQNVGTDILYSGTCAAARQAVIFGVRGIAVSVDPIDRDFTRINGFKYEAIADFVANNIEALYELSDLEKRVFVNINGGSFDSYKGVKFTDQLIMKHYTDHIKIIKENDKIASKYIFGNFQEKSEAITDFSIVRDGYIAISLVKAEPSCIEIDESLDGIKFSL